MRRLLPLLLVVSFVVLTPRAAKAEFNPLFFSLGVAKLPGVAFDIVGAARLGPHLGTFAEGGMANAAQAGFASNLVTLGLHVVSIGSFWVVSFLDIDLEEAMAPSFMINAIADLTIGVLGIATGVDLLLQRNAAGIAETDAGVGATWSAAVNLVMGGFGVIWFLPMTVGALLSAGEAWAGLPVHQERDFAIALVPNGAGAALVGRF